MHVLHLLMKQIDELVYVILAVPEQLSQILLHGDGHYSESGNPAVTTFINVLYSNNTLWNATV